MAKRKKTTTLPKQEIIPMDTPQQVDPWDSIKDYNRREAEQAKITPQHVILELEELKKLIKDILNKLIEQDKIKKDRQS